MGISRHFVGQDGLGSLNSTILSHDMVEVCSRLKRRHRKYLMYHMSLGAISMEHVGCLEPIFLERIRLGKSFVQGEK